MNQIEDQALTVYHFWLVEGVQGEQFSRYLNGLFELVKEKFPEATAEIVDEALKLRR